MRHRSDCIGGAIEIAVVFVFVFDSEDGEEDDDELPCVIGESEGDELFTRKLSH